jgi:purine-binding chemotaxis protein CheW
MTQYVTFTLGGGLYGVDVTRVQEALRAHTRTRVPLAPVDVAGLVNLRGQVVLTIDLRARLGMEPLAADLVPMMIVVEVDGEQISLLVDDLGDVIDIEEQQLAPPPDTLSTSSREVILGVYALEHSLLLALDIDRATSG